MWPTATAVGGSRTDAPLKSPGRGDSAVLTIAELMSPLRGSACSLCTVIPRLAPWATFLRRWRGLAWGHGLILARTRR